jgi:mono/diheme cytochrome c family protein
MLRLRPLLLIPLVTYALLGLTVIAAAAPPAERATQPGMTPTPDRLAIPVLPASPAPLDIGRNVYYYNCMPCHGDRGQGLTDEWRAVWVEDHQNCWARGCHGGRVDDEGFTLARKVPAVIGSGLKRFQTLDELVAFLRDTQPPQRPGALSEADYDAVAVFLMHENGRPAGAAGVDEVAVLSLMVVAGVFFIGIVLVHRFKQVNR